MKRRILIEVDVDDKTPGAMLKILLTLQNALNTEQSRDTLVKWGLDLLTNECFCGTWYQVPIETMDVPEEG